MRAAPLPFLVAIALAATAALAPAAQGPPLHPVARASALLVQIVSPQGRSEVHGQAASRHGVVTRSASLSIPADGSLVTVKDGSETAAAATGARRASARAAAGLAEVAMLGGLIKATGVRVTATATADGVASDGAGQTRFATLEIAGKAVAPRPEQVIRLAGIGTLTVAESVDALRMPGGHRGFEVALHLRLHKAFGAYPAGTEVLVGYAEAGAAAPAPPPVVPALVVPAPSNGDAAGHDTSRAELPPPGGFTRTPPISDAARAQLLSSEYVFPVVGGAKFSDDFGGPRADTGFHQGIDLFAPDGTPLVAVHDGTLFLVGWNRLGGRRIWLDDGHGNLFYYAHLSGFAPIAQDGAVVHAGDVIGFAGDSGDAQGTPFHLHFEIHPGGGWAVPPLAYVTAWLASTPGINPAASQAGSSPAPAPTPDAVTESGSTDLGSASGLDDGSIAAAVGGSPEAGGAVPLPDAVQDVSTSLAPAFLGTR